MTKLADWLAEAGAACGLPVEVDFALHLPDGRQLNSVVRICGIGGDEGTLVFSDYGAIRANVETLVSMGYGFSVLDEPEVDETFDLESFKEMFEDWGWRVTQ